MGKQVTKREAKLVLAKVKAKWAAGEPKLYEPEFHASGWTVAWESGPEGWVSKYAEYAVPGLFLEPVSHWCLGIYRDE